MNGAKYEWDVVGEGAEKDGDIVKIISKIYTSEKLEKEYKILI